MTRVCVVAIAALSLGTACELRLGGSGDKPPAPPTPSIVNIKQPSPPQPTAGRFRVENPVPSMARDVMLVDTVTGETWQACAIDKKGLAIGWCPMPRIGGSPVASVPVALAGDPAVPQNEVPPGAAK